MKSSKSKQPLSLKKTAKLPDLPKGKEFEEFLAAYFQGSGYYVERDIIDRQKEDVLELDIINTLYTKGQIPESKLCEVKSGKWGFGDIFKIRGWLDYLHMDSGCLLVQQPHKSLSFFQYIANSLNIDVIAISDLDKAAECLRPLIIPEKVNDHDITSWRFAYWVERQLLDFLKSKKSSASGKKCYIALDRYFSLINNRSFFTRNVIDRAQKLYECYQEYPNISAKLGHELCGENFEEDYKTIPTNLFEQAYYKCELNDLAISTFIEHRARLSILKSAIDYSIYKTTGNDQNETYSLKFGDRNWEYKLLDMLPKSFKSGLCEISKHKYYYRYPVFWQWFLWVFGGFTLKDYLDKEYALLSKKTEIPIEEIPNALKAYDILFPRNDSWFIEPKNTNMVMLKVFPMPFRGIGANYRRLKYAEDKKWDGLHFTASHTHDDLRKWNNLTIDLLNLKI